MSDNQINSNLLCCHKRPWKGIASHLRWIGTISVILSNTMESNERWSWEKDAWGTPLRILCADNPTSSSPSSHPATWLETPSIFSKQTFFCPGLNMIRLIGFFLTFSLKFVTVLLSIPFPRYVKLLSIQCFPIYIEYKVKTFLIEKEFLCKNWILQKYWNEIEIFCSSMCSSLVPGASLCYKTKPTT